MKLYLDENMSRREAAALREAGHDVVAVNEVPALQGLPDSVHARLAEDLHCVLVTKDGDFGAIYIRSGIPKSGVVFIKHDANVPTLANRLPGILARHSEPLARGAFVTVDPEGERIRDAPVPSTRP